MKEYDAFLALCYHYIRPEKNIDPFPRILGNRIVQLRRQIELIRTEYQILSPDDILSFYYDGCSINCGKPGLLFTFDDGLSDHYLAAQILADKNIQAIFFIPTCILKDAKPANPTIIHYCLAKNGITEFLSAYRCVLEKLKVPVDLYNVRFEKGKDDPWNTIDKIKSIFKYRLGYNQSRVILLHLYKKMLQDYDPRILRRMHLTSSQIREMLDMGHSIGAHSHSHPSVAACDLKADAFQREVIEPKKYLEGQFNVPVVAFAYPFGEERDCFMTEEFVNKFEGYKLTFTVEESLNTRETSPLELGRYMPTSIDSEYRLLKKLESIIAAEMGREKISNLE